MSIRVRRDDGSVAGGDFGGVAVVRNGEQPERAAGAENYEATVG